MAGGSWIAQNKVRPGAYINFESEIPSQILVGTRGIATLAMDLDWGAEDKLIELSAYDLISGKALAKIGMTSKDEESLLPSLALQNAVLLKIYRKNKGGVKATTTSGDLTVTAKYSGTFGNKIAILVTKGTGTAFVVETYADGYLVDTQKAVKIEELKANDYVTFSGEGNLVELASTLLTNGTNGTVDNEETAYSSYFEVLRSARWNTMAVTIGNATIVANTVAFIKEMREDEGKYVQAVVPYLSEASDAIDYEGIINNVNGVVMNERTISNVEFTAWVAGATAGADITESLTGKVVINATEIVDMLASAEIVEGLGSGLFILSLNQDGSVKVEKDINSLHTFTQKDYIFSKNRVIRELDEIGSQITNIWEQTYLGKVTNNEAGRTLFKASIITYLTELRNKGAIDEFDNSLISVEAGNDLDAVVANIAVKPLDSMEFLYMTVNIEK